MSTASWILIIASVVPWLALEVLFFVRMRRHHTGAVGVQADDGENP
jgi:hypothetical protein